ncbi:MAG TPA: methyltransferase domain-containing protein [Chloroflexota bacterium]
MTRAADWDAARYHQVARPHAAWGTRVLDRLSLRGDELVLDAGCGSGGVTAQLVQRLPRGRVIAADVSPAMLAEARRTLEPFADRLSFVQVDLREIDRVLDQRVDVVFSTATFHWIADHALLFAALRHVSKPAARLVAQFGGGDNLADFMASADTVAARQPFATELDGRRLWRFFYTPEQTRQRLEAAGFGAVDAWLEPSPQTFADRAALAAFCRTVVLSSHVAALPESLRDAFVAEVVDEVVARQGACLLDYVRLNVEAIAVA